MKLDLALLPYKSRNADPHNTPGEARIQWQVVARGQLNIIADWVDEQGIHQILIKNVPLKDIDKEKKKMML